MYSTQPIPETYASLYYLSLGATPFLLSVGMGFAASIAIALMQVPGGYLADRHGRKWLVSTMSFGVAAGYLFYILAPSWQFIVAGMVLQNLCLIYQPALLAMLLDSLKPESRGKGFSFQSVVVSLVSLPAPLIAQTLILKLGFNTGMRLAYTLVLIAYLAAAALRSKLTETLPPNGNSAKPNLLEAFRNYPSALKESWRVWSKVPRSAYWIFITSLVMNGLVAGCQLYFVVYATRVLKLSESQWALIMAFMYLSTALPALAAGLRMDTKGRKRILILGYLLHAPAMLLFVYGSFHMLLFAFFLYGLGHMLQVNGSQIFIGDVVPRELRGKAIGIIQFIMFFSQAVAQVALGFAYAYIMPQLPFLILAAASLPLALTVVFKVSEPKVRET